MGRSHSPSAARDAPPRAALALLLGCGALFGARAQDAGPAAAVPASGWRPTFSTELGYLETRGRIDGDNGREGLLRVSPGLRYFSQTGRVHGNLDYTANLIDRQGRASTAGGQVQNALDAAFVAEAVPNTATVDGQATISQQAISPFGQQTVAGGLQANNNRTEVATATVSPDLHARLGSVAQFDLRGTAGLTRTRSDQAADSNNTGLSAQLRSAAPGALVDWSLDAVQSRVDFRGARSFETRAAHAAVTVTPVPELRLSLRGGRESVSDDAVAGRTTTTTVGAGLQWTPSPRTTLDIEGEKRYFGHSAQVAFSHRMARSVWTYSYTRDVSHGADTLALGKPQTAYSLFYDQLGSITDPAARDQAARDALAQAGLDPAQTVQVGFLTSTLSLLSRHNLGLVLSGQRTTFTLQAFAAETSQLVFSSGSDPVAAEPVRQLGYLSSLSYQLTPLTALVLNGSLQRTLGTTTEGGNELKSAGLSLSSQLGRRLTALLGARYTVFNSPTEPYRETSVTGSLSLRF